VPNRRTSDRRRDWPVTTYLAEDDVDRLDALAERSDVSRSALARRLLRAAIASMSGDNEAVAR
jgi:hypothetical protein